MHHEGDLFIALGGSNILSHGSLNVLGGSNIQMWLIGCISGSNIVKRGSLNALGGSDIQTWLIECIIDGSNILRCGSSNVLGSGINNEFGSVTKMTPLLPYHRCG